MQAEGGGKPAGLYEVRAAPLPGDRPEDCRQARIPLGYDDGIAKMSESEELSLRGWTAPPGGMGRDRPPSRSVGAANGTRFGGVNPPKGGGSPPPPPLLLVLG